VNPVVRLRVAKQPLPERNPPPLSFAFIESFEHLPANLLPPPVMAAPTPTSVHSSPVQHPVHSHRTQRPPNHQDVLVFDPIEGSLSLRRFILELRSRDQTLSFPTSLPDLGGTSMSLPGPSPSGRLGVSPPNSSSRSSASSKDLTVELVGRETIVASWNLRRSQSWQEIRGSLQSHLNSSSHPAKAK
jgi:hypothetical protein